jgi:hypothetical protein
MFPIVAEELSLRDEASEFQPLFIPARSKEAT